MWRAGLACTRSFGELAQESDHSAVHSCARSRRDKLVAQGRADKLSAAVVFLPEHTLHFGQHSDRCCCVEMYGEVRNVVKTAIVMVLICFRVPRALERTKKCR